MNCHNNQKIYISGHQGMVGSALVKKAKALGYKDIVTASRSDLDLTNQSEVTDFIRETAPEQIIIAAAKVGGIHANSTYPAEFIYENLMIAANTIHAAYQAGVKRLLFLGSSCIYPKMAPQPMTEDCLLTSTLEPTNEAYAVAKIAGLKLCQYYRQQYGVMYHSAMPTNLYGYGDNYHPDNSHVIPGLIQRFHEAKENQTPSVTMWGTGTPRREFLFVDDLADGCFHLLHLENPPDWVNLGYGEDVSIQELAQAIAKTVGYEGDIGNDLSKPDGTPQKLMSPSVLRETGWSPTVHLEEGLKLAYGDFLEKTQEGKVRAV